MRVNESIGIFSQFESISPEVARAQRMAELRNLAEYRARHLQAIKDWSDPVKRAKIQADHAAAEHKARESLAGEYIDNYRVRKVRNDVFVGTLADTVKINPIVKPLPKLTWWQRLLARLKR